MTLTKVYIPTQQRRDTAATWTANDPILYAGQIGYETDTQKMKVGDGSTAWSGLSYVSAAATISDGSITNAKLADVATQTIKGRIAVGTGVPTDLTATQVRTIINVEDGADVTDATNVDAAGAVMNTDTSTASMSFVIDEDDMSSDSATKVPTQQSVKAYADTKADLNNTFNAQTGTTYTLVLSDNSKVVTLSNASAITMTVPPNSSVAFPTGAEITIIQKGAGQVTVAAGSGVTINSADSNLKLTGQYSGATLIKESTNTWYLIGDLSA